MESDSGGSEPVVPVKLDHAATPGAARSLSPSEPSVLASGSFYTDGGASLRSELSAPPPRKRTAFAGGTAAITPDRRSTSDQAMLDLHSSSRRSTTSSRRTGENSSSGTRRRRESLVKGVVALAEISSRVATRKRASTKRGPSESDGFAEDARRAFSRRTRGIRFGAAIDADPRLKSMLKRETHFITVTIARVRSYKAAAKDWLFTTLGGGNALFMLLTVLAVQVLAIVACSQQLPSAASAAGGSGLSDNDICLRVAEDGHASWQPATLNSLAALMLAFYANTCLSLYRDTYSACQSLKQSVMDLTTLVCGTISPKEKALRLEFWRCANLFHLASYVISDRTRNTYSFENFLVPVAEAFGEFDGEEKLGMINRKELEALRAIDNNRKPDGHKRRASEGGAEDDRGSKFSNARRDVQSPAALMHSSLGARLFTLADLSQQRGLTNANWPAWTSVLSGLRVSSERLKQCALFRLPRVYYVAVATIIALAVLADSVLVGVRSGLALRDAGVTTTSSSTSSSGLVSSMGGVGVVSAWLGMVASLLVNGLLAFFLIVLMRGLRMMERSIGSDALDMPGLSYVVSAAEMGLRMVIATSPSQTGGPLASKTGFLAMNMLLSVDEESIFNNGGGGGGGDGLSTPQPSDRGVGEPPSLASGASTQSLDGLLGC